jgi:predicted membrane-bound spermidine synthase
MSRLPDEDQGNEVVGPHNGDHFHVLASWRQDDGGVYVYAASTVSTSSAAAERWARDQMLIQHGSRGEPDVVSVMTHEEWGRAIADVRRLIGE